jgi:peptidoglycan/LPS O-acetylase OafA/YrhL
MIKESTLAAVVAPGLVLSAAAFADPYNSTDRAIGGGLMGAGTGATIGALAGGGLVPASVRPTTGDWARLPAPPPVWLGHRSYHHCHYVNHRYYRNYWPAQVGLSK